MFATAFELAGEIWRRGVDATREASVVNGAEIGG